MKISEHDTNKKCRCQFNSGLLHMTFFPGAAPPLCFLICQIPTFPTFPSLSEPPLFSTFHFFPEPPYFVVARTTLFPRFLFFQNHFCFLVCRLCSVPTFHCLPEPPLFSPNISLFARTAFVSRTALVLDVH